MEAERYYKNNYEKDTDRRNIGRMEYENSVKEEDTKNTKVLAQFNTVPAERTGRTFKQDSIRMLIICYSGHVL